MIKIIHTADNHLCKIPYGRKIMRYECFRNYMLMVDYAIKNNINAILNSGDLFNIPNPTADSLKMVYNCFKKLEKSKIKTYLVDGNHDKYSSFYNAAIHQILYPDSDYLICEVLNWSKYNFKGIDIYLLPYSQITNKEDIINVLNDIALDASKTNSTKILVSHIEIEEYMKFSDNISLNDLPTQYFDYIALGHIHKQTMDVKDNCYICYSSSTYPTSSTDMRNGKPSFNIIEFDDSLKITDVYPYELPFRDIVIVDKNFYDFDKITEDSIVILEDYDLKTEINKKKPFMVLNSNKKKYDDVEDVMSSSVETMEMLLESIYKTIPEEYISSIKEVINYNLEGVSKLEQVNDFYKILEKNARRFYKC